MYYYFAQADAGYGCQNYGETDGYNSCEVSGATDTSLTNTGTFVAPSMIIGALLLAAALYLLIKGKKK